MPANAAIYLPADDVDLRKLHSAFDHVDAVGSELEHFLIDLAGTKLRFNAVSLRGRTHARATGLIDGLQRYASQLEPAAGRASVIEHIGRTKVILGLVTTSEFTGEIEAWLYAIAGRWNGLIFAADCVIGADATTLLGPPDRP